MKKVTFIIVLLAFLSSWYCTAQITSYPDFYGIKGTSNEKGLPNVVGQQVVEFEDCIIPQGISPNDDGFNDTFDLSNCNVVRIEIFNRLGRMVYSKESYTNEWRGQSNNGDELPVGTYFYTLVYEGGEKQLSSWVYINK